MVMSSEKSFSDVLVGFRSLELVAPQVDHRVCCAERSQWFAVPHAGTEHRELVAESFDERCDLVFQNPIPRVTELCRIFAVLM